MQFGYSDLSVGCFFAESGEVAKKLFIPFDRSHGKLQKLLEPSHETSPELLVGRRGPTVAKFPESRNPRNPNWPHSETDPVGLDP